MPNSSSENVIRGTPSFSDSEGSTTTFRGRFAGSHTVSNPRYSVKSSIGNGLESLEIGRQKLQDVVGDFHEVDVASRVHTILGGVEDTLELPGESREWASSSLSQL